MGKIKYQGGITRYITTTIASWNKKKFDKFIKSSFSTLSNKIGSNHIEIEIVSFSSSKDFCDQLLSILSFLRYVGIPALWTVYSDGTHTEQEINFLEKSSRFIKVKIINFKDEKEIQNNCKKDLLPYKEYLVDYANKQPLGKKLFVYLNYQVSKPTLFIDADILFYNLASDLTTIIKENTNGWYLPDAEWGCLDSRYKSAVQKQLYQVNSGFILFNQNLPSLKKGLEFLKSLNFKYEYFTEQTVMHILLKENNFMPLDPRKFILDSTDQFNFSYLFTKEKIAIRHYTGPVRHKMWQKNWKWHLSLS